MTDTDDSPPNFRTIFVSDVHLGTRGAQAELLLDFMRHNDAQRWFLVGDIVDGWRLKHGWYWPQSHNDVIQKLLRKARKGAQITFIPGNHDEFGRHFLGLNFGGVVVQDRAFHTTADGRKLLILHGDQFDVVVRNARWIALLGDWAYDAALLLNTYLNLCRRFFGFGYWSFSAWAKLKVKKAVNFIGAFEAAVVEEARREHVHGVVCGHIHHAAIRDIDGITYVNTGDFVESCTAVVEHMDGRLEILRWQTLTAQREAVEQPAPETVKSPARAAA